MSPFAIRRDHAPAPSPDPVPAAVLAPASDPASRPARAGGFSLIEIMIVVAITGILAAIAYPSYGEYVKQTRRADAHFSLLAARQGMERCRSTTYTYENCSIAAWETSEEGYYTLELKAGTTATSFEIEATAAGAQVNDTECASLTIDHLDQPKPESCW